MVSVTIESVIVENVAGPQSPEEKKPVLYFVGKEKGLVMNKTNANTVSAVYGDETDDWIGKTIKLYVAKVQFKADMVDAIRINVSRDAGRPQAAQAPARSQPRAAATVPADDSPFADDADPGEQLRDEAPF